MELCEFKISRSKPYKLYPEPKTEIVYVVPGKYVSPAPNAGIAEIVILGVIVPPKWQLLQVNPSAGEPV
jgi:hypothetical protein